MLVLNHCVFINNNLLKGANNSAVGIVLNIYTLLRTTVLISYVM